MDVGKLFSFEGRVGRGVFWGIGIANLIVLGVAYAIAMGGSNALATILGVVVLIASSWVSIATNVKRWHDRDKSGAWYFITFVPIIGGIWALVETGFLAGTDGGNRYGSPDSGSPFVGEAGPYKAAA
jgi:uncharacterized membrane protein YhaH (DUF805 family)